MVTSTQDAVSTAGLAAIRGGGQDRRFTVMAPAPADVGAQFTPQKLEQYRAVVFLNTGMASPLNDAQRANFESYFKKGGGFVGIGSAIETDSCLAVPDRPPRHARPPAAPRRRSRRSRSPTASTTRARTCPQYWERTDSCYNFTTNVRGCRTCSRPSSRSRSGRSRRARTLNGHRRRHDGRRPPGLVVQGLPGRPLVLHRRSATPRRLRRRPANAPQGRDQLGRGPGRPGLQRLRRHRANELPADQDRCAAEPAASRSASTSCPDGRVLQTDRRGALRLHDPATGTTRSSPTSPTRACR